MTLHTLALSSLTRSSYTTIVLAPNWKFDQVIPDLGCPVVFLSSPEHKTRKFSIVKHPLHNSASVLFFVQKGSLFEAFHIVNNRIDAITSTRLYGAVRRGEPGQFPESDEILQTDMTIDPPLV